MSSVSSHSSDDDVRDVIGESGRARSALVAESSSPPPDGPERRTPTSPEFGSDEGIVEKLGYIEEATSKRVNGYNTYEV
jgi:hypothetical protein